MPRTILKYTLEITDSQTIQMPSGAKLLHVGVQYGALRLWAEVDPMAPQVARQIRFIGTGHHMPYDHGTFIGTVIVESGLVLHVYDVVA